MGIGCCCGGISAAIYLICSVPKLTRSANSNDNAGYCLHNGCLAANTVYDLLRPRGLKISKGPQEGRLFKGALLGGGINDHIRYKKFKIDLKQIMFK